MRKRSLGMESRFGRDKGDRSNFPQTTGHRVANDKEFQRSANSLLRRMLGRIGIGRIPRSDPQYGAQA